MSESVIITLARDAIIMALMMAAPFLAASLVIGLVVSIFQAATQISEMTLTFVPKMIAMGVIVLVLGPWMLQQIVRYTARLFDMLPMMVR